MMATIAGFTMRFAGIAGIFRAPNAAAMRRNRERRVIASSR
jgi:hypothetical protein